MNQTGKIMRFYVKCRASLKFLRPAGYPHYATAINNKMPDIPNFTAHELLSSYHDGLKEAVDFKAFKANEVALNMDAISTKVTDIKVCVDHSFSEDEIVKCRTDFLNLAGSLTYDEAKKMKAKAKKAPIYTGEGAVNIEKYLKKK